MMVLNGFRPQNVPMRFLSFVSAQYACYAKIVKQLAKWQLRNPKNSIDKILQKQYNYCENKN